MDPAKLKVVELRQELQQRGLDTRGVKAVLVDRLREALEAEGAAIRGKTSPTLTFHPINGTIIVLSSGKSEEK